MSGKQRNTARYVKYLVPSSPSLLELDSGRGEDDSQQQHKRNIAGNNNHNNSHSHSDVLARQQTVSDEMNAGVSNLHHTPNANSQSRGGRGGLGAGKGVSSESPVIATTVVPITSLVSPSTGDSLSAHNLHQHASLSGIHSSNTHSNTNQNKETALLVATSSQREQTRLINQYIRNKKMKQDQIQREEQERDRNIDESQLHHNDGALLDLNSKTDLAPLHCVGSAGGSNLTLPSPSLVIMDCSDLSGHPLESVGMGSEEDGGQDTLMDKENTCVYRDEGSGSNSCGTIDGRGVGDEGTKAGQPKPITLFSSSGSIFSPPPPLLADNNVDPTTCTSQGAPAQHPAASAGPLLTSSSSSSTSNLQTKVLPSSSSSSAYQKIKDVEWKQKNREEKEFVHAHVVGAVGDDISSGHANTNNNNDNPNFYLNSRNQSPTTAYLEKRRSRRKTSAALSVDNKNNTTNGTHARPRSDRSNTSSPLPAAAVVTRKLSIGIDGSFHIGATQYGASEGALLLRNNNPPTPLQQSKAAAKDDKPKPKGNEYGAPRSPSYSHLNEIFIPSCPPLLPPPREEGGHDSVTCSFLTDSVIPNTYAALSPQRGSSSTWQLENESPARLSADPPNHIAMKTMESSTARGPSTARTKTAAYAYKQVTHRGNKFRQMLNKAVASAAADGSSTASLAYAPSSRVRRHLRRASSFGAGSGGGVLPGTSRMLSSESSYLLPRSNGQVPVGQQVATNLTHGYGSISVPIPAASCDAKGGRYPIASQGKEELTDPEGKAKLDRFMGKLLSSTASPLLSPLFTTSHGTTFNLPPVPKNQMPTVLGGAGAVRHKGTTVFSTHLPPPRLVAHNALPAAPKGSVCRSIELVDTRHHHYHPYREGEEEGTYNQKPHQQAGGRALEQKGEERAATATTAAAINGNGVTNDSFSTNPVYYDPIRQVYYQLLTPPKKEVEERDSGAEKEAGQKNTLSTSFQTSDGEEEEVEADEEDEDDDEYEVITYADGAADLMTFFVPTAVHHVLTTLLLIIPLACAGQILGQHGLSAASAGLFFATIIVLYPLQGIFFAIETVCSHLYSRCTSIESNAMGLVLQRGVAVAVFGYAVAQVFLLYTTKPLMSFIIGGDSSPSFLAALGAPSGGGGVESAFAHGSSGEEGHGIHSASLAASASAFVSFLPLYLVSTIGSSAFGKFLTAQTMPSIPLLGTLTGIGVSILWQGALFYTHTLSSSSAVPLANTDDIIAVDIRLISLGMGVAALCQLAAMVGLAFFGGERKALRRSIGPLRLREALQLKDVRDFVRVALPPSVHIAAEAAAYDVTILMAVAMGPGPGSAWSALMLYEYLLTFASAGLSAAACAKVGAAIGANQPINAKTYAWTAIGLAVGWGVLIAVPLFSIFYEEMMRAMGASVPEASRVVAFIYPVLVVLDLFESTCQGILSGARTNHLGAPLFAATVWGVGLPLAYGLSSGLGIRVANLVKGRGFVLRVLPDLDTLQKATKRATKKKTNEKETENSDEKPSQRGTNRKMFALTNASPQQNTTNTKGPFSKEAKSGSATANEGRMRSDLPHVKEDDDELTDFLFGSVAPRNGAKQSGVGSGGPHALTTPAVDFPQHIVDEYIRRNEHGLLVTQLLEPMVGLRGLGVGFSLGLALVCVLLCRAVKRMDWVGIALRYQIEEDEEDDEEDEEEEESEEEEDEEEDEEESEDDTEEEDLSDAGKEMAGTNRTTDTLLPSRTNEPSRFLHEKEAQAIPSASCLNSPLFLADRSCDKWELAVVSDTNAARPAAPQANGLSRHTSPIPKQPSPRRYGSTLRPTNYVTVKQ